MPDMVDQAARRSSMSASVGGISVMVDDLRAVLGS